MSSADKKKRAHAGFEKDGEILLWYIDHLWELSKELPVFEYEISSFNGFDQNVWFNSENEPTVNNVLMHMKKIEKANLSYPIILSSEGIVLDGVHRICRAKIEGLKSIPAVQFEKDPEPDFRR